MKVTDALGKHVILANHLQTNRKGQDHSASGCPGFVPVLIRTQRTRGVGGLLVGWVYLCVFVRLSVVGYR